MNICIFCGSSIGNKKIYKDKAIDLAALMANQGHTLIYGAGSVGLMGVVSDVYIDKKAKLIGVAPHFLMSKEVVRKDLAELILVETMSERKDKMTELSDAFIAMPGGFGTLDELTEVLTLLQLEQSEKAVALYNVGGYFDPLIEQVKRGVKEKFILKEHAESMIISDDAEEILTLCETFKAPKINKWIDELKNKNTY